MDWWGSGSVLSEAVSKCHSWLEGIAEVSAVPLADTEGLCTSETESLPWDVPSETDEDIRRSIKDRMLALSQDRDVFLHKTPSSHAIVLTPSLSASAGAVLKEDPALRQLRFQLVPRHVSEEQFWRRYFAAVAAVRRTVCGNGRAGSAEAVGVTMADGSEASAGDHGGTVASGSLPGAHVRWQLPPASKSHMPGADPTTAGLMPEHMASRLVKTISQVSSMAEALLSPRSLQSERTAAMAAAGADAMSFDSATMSATTAKSRGHSCSSAVASDGATAAPASPTPAVPRPLHHGGSNAAAAAGAVGSECSLDPAAVGTSGTPAHADASRRAPEHGMAEGDLPRPLPRFKWHTSSSLPPPSAGGGTAAASADAFAAPGPPIGTEELPDGNGPAPERGSAAQPQPQLQMQPSAAHVSPALLGGGQEDVVGSDRDGSEWSHCSDQFGVLSAELEAHDSEWMVL